MSELVIAIRDGNYQEYLRDESRSVGEAESISFPRNEGELRAIVQSMVQQQRPITIQGARTGLTGAAVPHGGHALNLSRMNRITGLRYCPTRAAFFVTVQPGVLLSDLRQALANLSFDTTKWSEQSKQALQHMRNRGRYHFTPDPTETSASIGGLINCNASGARSFLYGPTRPYVQGLRVVLADGALLTLRRKEQRVNGGRVALTTDSGRQIVGQLPQYAMPQVKNAAGYHLQPNMDVIDLFIGSEGTLGIISEAELRLLPLPQEIWGATVFFRDEISALRFVRAVRGDALPPSAPRLLLQPAAIEYFDHCALDLLRHQKQAGTAFNRLQPLAAHYHTAIYVEFHGSGKDELSAAMLSLGHLITACGGNEDDTWLATNSPDMEQLRFFRHATPESVNMTIDQRRRINPQLTKLGTDMAVPDDKLIEMMALYRRRISELQLEAVAFGHIGDNHVHVNILPRNLDDYRKGKELYLEWARQAVSWGGTVSAEHGIGKLKTGFLAVMYGSDGLKKMRTVKHMFDPEGRLNPGNMFPQASPGLACGTSR